MMKVSPCVFASLLLTASCADPQEPDRAGEIKGDLAAKAHHTPQTSTKRISEAEHGSNVTLPAGSELLLELDANRTTPYEWRVIERPSILRLVSDQYVAPAPSNPAIAGAGGIQQYRFRAEQVGRGRLRLGYFNVASSEDESNIHLAQIYVPALIKSNPHNELGQMSNVRVPGDVAALLPTLRLKLAEANSLLPPAQATSCNLCFSRQRSMLLVSRELLRTQKSRPSTEVLRGGFDDL